MSSAQLQVLALILASQARVLGMQADNALREACGESPAYVAGHFLEEAQHLEQLSIQAINNG